MLALLLATLFLSFTSHHAVADDARFYQILNPKELGLGREKLTHLHFFFHEVVSAKNRTSVRAASAPMTNASPTLFGLLAVMDDPLTAGPDPASRKVGAAQGIYAKASQTESALLMAHTYVFTEGKFNGSTLSVLGRNAVFDPVRELSIVGGSGLFRFVRGYALAKTHLYNLTSGDAIVEYNVYVLHY